MYVRMYVHNKIFLSYICSTYKYYLRLQYRNHRIADPTQYIKKSKSPRISCSPFQSELTYFIQYIIINTDYRYPHHYLVTYIYNSNKRDVSLVKDEVYHNDSSNLRFSNLTYVIATPLPEEESLQKQIISIYLQGL